MDAKGVDRPVALLACRPGRSAAAVADLLHARGHEVHRRLEDAVATRRPLAVAVLDGEALDGAAAADAPALLRAVAATTSAWGGGQVLLIPAGLDGHPPRDVLTRPVGTPGTVVHALVGGVRRVRLVEVVVPASPQTVPATERRDARA